MSPNPQTAPLGNCTYCASRGKESPGFKQFGDGEVMCKPCFTGDSPDERKPTKRTHGRQPAGITTQAQIGFVPNGRGEMVFRAHDHSIAQRFTFAFLKNRQGEVFLADDKQQ